jgi:hypothetical protein
MPLPLAGRCLQSPTEPCSIYNNRSRCKARQLLFCHTAYKRVRICTCGGFRLQLTYRHRCTRRSALPSSTRQVAACDLALVLIVSFNPRSVKSSRRVFCYILASTKYVLHLPGSCNTHVALSAYVVLGTLSQAYQTML